MKQSDHIGDEKVDAKNASECADTSFDRRVLSPASVNHSFSDSLPPSPILTSYENRASLNFAPSSPSESSSSDASALISSSAVRVLNLSLFPSVYQSGVGLINIEKMFSLFKEYPMMTQKEVATKVGYGEERTSILLGGCKYKHIY